MKSFILNSFAFATVALFAPHLFAQQKYSDVVKFETDFKYNGAQVLAVTATEQKDNFQPSGMKCKSYNKHTDTIGSQRANLFCRIHLANEKAVSISGLYGPSVEGPLFDPTTKTTRDAQSNNGNFYCIYFVDAIFTELTCGIPIEAK